MAVPVLHLVAGPNGAGKTTFHQRIIAPTALEFVNADVLAAARWPGEEAVHAYEASALAATRREELFAERTSFATETVFSHPSKVELVRKAVNLGYLLYLHVILIPENLAVYRVADRVRHGGHGVPENKIRERYRRLWTHVADAVAIAHEARLYDNTRAGTPFRRVATSRDGGVVGATDWPAWTPAALRAVTRA